MAVCDRRISGDNITEEALFYCSRPRIYKGRVCEGSCRRGSTWKGLIGQNTASNYHVGGKLEGDL